MAITRRSFIAGSSGVLGLSLLPRTSVAAGASRVTPKRIVQLYFIGGIDTMYCTDARERGELDKGIEIPYKASEIIEAGPLRLAPSAAALARHSDVLAITNGINSGTVAHNTGSRHTRFLSTDYVTTRDPSILAQIARATAPDKPVHEVRIGLANNPGMYPTRGRNIILDSNAKIYWDLARVRSSNPNRFDTMVDRLRRARSSTRDAVAKAHMDATLSFFDAVSDTPWEKMTPPPPIELPPVAEKDREYVDFVIKGAAEHCLQKLAAITSMIERDVAPCYYLELDLNYDTHVDNYRQALSVPVGLETMARLLDFLRAKRVGDHTLLDETLVIGCSELGRFPFINLRRGKDHIPVVPLILAGAGVRPGLYGGTDRFMAGRTDISLETGRPTKRGGRELQFSDIASTVHHIFGVPQRASLNGQPLEYMLG